MVSSAPAQTLVILVAGATSTAVRFEPIMLAAEPTFTVMPFPKAPPSPLPQQRAFPVDVTAQAWLNPKAIIAGCSPPNSTYGRLSPMLDGVEPRLVVSPSPSCPYVLSPQHLTPTTPPDNNAQVNFSPTRTARTAVDFVPKSTYGNASMSPGFPPTYWVVEPTPSCPASFWPQHLTLVALTTAHTC